MRYSFIHLNRLHQQRTLINIFTFSSWFNTWEDSPSVIYCVYYLCKVYAQHLSLRNKFSLNRQHKIMKYMLIYFSICGCGLFFLCITSTNTLKAFIFLFDIKRALVLWTVANECSQETEFCFARARSFCLRRLLKLVLSFFFLSGVEHSNKYWAINKKKHRLDLKTWITGGFLSPPATYHEFLDIKHDIISELESQIF